MSDLAAPPYGTTSASRAQTSGLMLLAMASPCCTLSSELKSAVGGPVEVNLMSVAGACVAQNNGLERLVVKQMLKHLGPLDLIVSSPHVKIDDDIFWMQFTQGPQSNISRTRPNRTPTATCRGMTRATKRFPHSAMTVLVITLRRHWQALADANRPDTRTGALAWLFDLDGCHEPHTAKRQVESRRQSTTDILS